MFYRIYSAWYSLGSGRICPICGWEGHKFLSAGVEKRSDSLCPECDSKERHRLLWEYLSKESTFDSQLNVLYFAPVDGIEQKLRNVKLANVTTIDLMQEGVDIKSDISNLCLKNECFDLIICSHVLEHVPDDDAAIKELYRVLNQDGVAIILLPQDRGFSNTYEDSTITTKKRRKKEFGQSDHVRKYGMDVEDILSSPGFRVSTIDYIEQLDDDYIDKHGLKETSEWIYDRTLIFRCLKNPSG